jgi:hypothetical protein
MPMYSACGNAALPALGFPIRESTDHRLFSVSPWLFAAVHALLRLLVPRHPPCALLILTVIAPHSLARGSRTRAVIPVCWPAVQFSRSAEAPPRPHELPEPLKPAGAEPVSQNSTACGRSRRPLPNSGRRRSPPTSGPDRHFGSRAAFRARRRRASEGYRARGVRAPGRNRPLQVLELP